MIWGKGSGIHNVSEIIAATYILLDVGAIETVDLVAKYLLLALKGPNDLTARLTDLGFTTVDVPVFADCTFSLDDLLSSAPITCDHKVVEAIYSESL